MCEKQISHPLPLWECHQRKEYLGSGLGRKTCKDSSHQNQIVISCMRESGLEGSTMSVTTHLVLSLIGVNKRGRVKKKSVVNNSVSRCQ